MGTMHTHADTRRHTRTHMHTGTRRHTHRHTLAHTQPFTGTHTAIHSAMSDAFNPADGNISAMTSQCIPCSIHPSSPITNHHHSSPFTPHHLPTLNPTANIYRQCGQCGGKEVTPTLIENTVRRKVELKNFVIICYRLLGLLRAVLSQRN